MEKTISLQSKNFEKLIKEMYKYFPNMRWSEERIADVIINPEDRNQLVKEGYLHREPPFDRSVRRLDLYKDSSKVWYSLGPNALPLVSAWETEELTKSIKTMTNYIIFLTVLSIVLSGLSIYLTLTLK